jgi:hypothetical protein
MPAATCVAKGECTHSSGLVDTCAHVAQLSSAKSGHDSKVSTDCVACVRKGMRLGLYIYMGLERVPKCSTSVRFSLARGHVVRRRGAFATKWKWSTSQLHSDFIVDYTPVPDPSATSNLIADTERTDRFCTISLKTR